MFLMLAFVAVAHAEPGIEPVGAGQTVTASVPSYLLPEPYYDECLVKAGALGDTQQLLAICAEKSVLALQDARSELDALGQSYTELSIEFQDEIALTAKLEKKVALVKRQRNVAVVTAGGTALLLSAVIALNIAL